MRALLIGTALLALLPAVVCANEARNPLLTSTTAIRPDDSALVRAAKVAVASRLGTSGRVIDNSTLATSRGVLSTSSTVSDLPWGSSESMYPGGQPGVNLNAPAPQAQPDRAAQERKLQQLNQENARMHAESEEPYGGDVSEDRVQQRIEQIPGEVQQVQRQLNPAPPSNPTPQPPPPGDQQ